MWAKTKAEPPSQGQERPAKRPRLSQDDRDRGRDIKPKSHTPLAPGPRPKQENAHRSITSMTKEEQELMDTLLSGLEASMFDDMSSSQPQPQPPARSQRSQSPIKAKRTPLKPKAVRAMSPVKANIPRPLPSTRPAYAKPTAAAGVVKAQREPCAVKLERPSHAVTVNLEPPQLKLEPVQVQAKLEPPAYPSPPALVPLEKDANSEKTLLDDDDMYTFDFDLSDLSAFDADLLMAPPPPQVRYPILHPDVPPPPEGFTSTPWLRCTVRHIFHGIHFADGKAPDATALLRASSLSAGGSASSKTLLVENAKTPALLVVHLKERWIDVAVRVDDTVNIISPSLLSPISITYKDPSTFLIIHPDLMLTMTTIANAMPCPRKPILQSLIRVPGPSSKAVLYGNLGHALLQGALQDQEFKAAVTEERLEKEMQKEQTRMEVWGAGLNVRDVQDEVGGRAGKGFETFADKWVGPEPKVDVDLHSMPGDAQSLLSITGLHEIEEDIWSPKWGLKGKVDASVQASIVLDRKIKNPAKEIHVTPLEIKTGRSIGVMNHRAQTMLYTLLMEDRYGVPVPAGLLYYSQLDTVLRVEARPAEIRALITARNELASYLIKTRKLAVAPDAVSGGSTQPADLEDSFLPPTIDSARECKTCYAVDTCMLYRKTTDRVPVEEDDPIGSLYEEKMGHMTEKDSEFFRKWENLLTVEEQDIGRLRKELWTMGAEEREKRGRCFGNMVIDSYTNDVGTSLAKIHRHTYTFARAASVLHTATQSGRTNLLSGHITRGDPVNISIEPDLLCLQRGFVTELTAEHISIGVTYTIDTAALLKRTVHRVKQRDTSSTDQLIFRIDKDEMMSGIAKMRNNLAQLFFAGGDEKRRSLIVHDAVPRYDLSRVPIPEEIPASLNEDQVAAMSKVLTAEDYALILGMPGTGKTTTIAEIIKALVGRGKSVLLASYTHSAVDTILMKLVNESFGILRLGNIDKVHPDVQHLTLEAMNSSASMAQLEERLMGPPVVATTCLSIEHPLFFRRTFDYCIIDEASQITLPTILGPLRFAETFVLVGDHYQLPPIVKNHEARKAGLDVSLFKLLSDRRPEAVVDLRYQYRMNEDIMSLSNTLVYDGRLRVGNERVGRRGLVLPMKKGCGGEEKGCGEGEECWVQSLLKESVKAVFVDTDGLPAEETRVGDLVQNPTEAIVVRQFVQALTGNGIKEEDIAVITPYRQQIKVLNGLFKDKPKVEVMTADKSQGRDKDVVLISLVRSNEVGNVGDLLRDWRRINVSFTRAKKKLVIFGSRKTLGTDKLLGDFLALMEKKEWRYTLKPGAEGVHPLEAAVKVELDEASRKAEKEEEKEKGQRRKVGKVGKVGEAILAGNPFVKEIMRNEA